MSISQLRVTAAEPGRVDFELDIKKEHTVGLYTPSIISLLTGIRTVSTSSMVEQLQAWVGRTV